MPDYEVVGASRESGRSMRMAVRAVDRDDAERHASDMGMLVGAVHPADRSWPDAPMVATRSAMGAPARSVVDDGHHAAHGWPTTDALTGRDVRRIARAVGQGVFFGGLLLWIATSCLLPILDQVIRAVGGAAQGR